MDSVEDTKFACVLCVKDAYLKKLITKSWAELRTCNYCDAEEHAISIDDLADQVERAFDRHFVRTMDRPDDYEQRRLSDRESSFEWHRKGTDVLWVIAKVADVREQIAQDVLEVLEARHSDMDCAAMGEEQEFDFGSRYAVKGPDDLNLREEWREIEQSLKTSSRYFNRTAEAFFDRLFSNLDGLSTAEGQHVIVFAGPGCETTSYFRARVFHRDDALEKAMARPDLELAPPPSRLARAGRMNAQGIASFYGAVDPQTALSEVRPPVGSKVLVGRFDLVRQLRLLDIQALRSVFVEGSYFDPAYLEQLELALFMGRLSEKMTLPVMPDDEASEYLITQMIADYLSRSTKPSLDGMVFPSVQRSGERSNVVLFHHASRVVRWENPPGMDILASADVDWDEKSFLGYHVSELLTPPEDYRPDVRYDYLGPYNVSEKVPHDPRVETLSINRTDLKALEVHHIKNVDFGTKTFMVTRSRTEKGTLPF